MSLTKLIELIVAFKKFKNKYLLENIFLIQT